MFYALKKVQMMKPRKYLGFQRAKSRSNCANQESIGNINEKLNEHMETCEDGSYRCKLCGKTENKRKGAMIYHIETHMEGLSYTCPICQKSFRYRHSLFSHKTHFHKF